MNDEIYTIIVHPSLFNDLKKTPSAKELWKMKYREERIKNQHKFTPKNEAVLLDYLIKYMEYPYNDK
jgi:hypothetical protein